MVSLQQEAGEARGEYLHFSPISHWNEHYRWNNGLSPDPSCQSSFAAALAPGFIFVQAWSRLRRSGDSAQGALGIARPAATCTRVRGSNEQAGMMERARQTGWLRSPYWILCSW